MAKGNIKKITMISCLILAMIMPQFKCIDSEYLFTILDSALLNNSQNLYRLHQVFYPADRIQTDTVYLFIDGGCGFTVRNITDLDTANSWSPAFIECRCETQSYCAHYSIEFSLSVNEVLDSYSRLLNFITKFNYNYNIFQYIDYVSFELLSSLTLIQLSSMEPQQGGNYIEISLSIDELYEMPSESEVIEELPFVLEWVSVHPSSGVK